MGKRIRTIIVFFFLLIIAIIGNIICAPLDAEEIVSAVPDDTTEQQIQEPQSPVKKTIYYLTTHNQADIPNQNIFIPGIKTYDFKPLPGNVINSIHMSYHSTTKLIRTCNTGRPPACKRITYYIYTLEKILI